MRTSCLTILHGGLAAFEMLAADMRNRDDASSNVLASWIVRTVTDED